MSKFRISNTNASQEYRAAVRVYGPTGDKIGEVFINKHNPLGYLRAHPGSRYHDALFYQVSGAMDGSEYAELFNCERMVGK